MLETNIYGNTLLHWLVALGAALIAGVVLVSVRSQGLRWLRAHDTPERARRFALPLAVFEATRPWVLVLVALFIGAQLVELPRKADRIVDHVAVIAVIAQAAFWASDAIRRWLARQVAAKRETDAAAATTVSVLGFVAQIALWGLVVLLALENLGFNITTLLAGLGIGGIAVALAAQNILGDLFASVTIALDKPFAIGDFIVAGDVMGTIEHVGLKTTRVRSLSGEQIILANSDLLKSRVRNFQRLRERRIEFGFGVAYGTPAAKLEIVPGIVRQAIERQAGTRFDRAHFKSYGDSALLFEAAYFVQDPDYNRYMDIQQAINLAIHRRLEEERIVLARLVPGTIVVGERAVTSGEHQPAGASAPENPSPSGAPGRPAGDQRR